MDNEMEQEQNVKVESNSSVENQETHHEKAHHPEHKKECKDCKRLKDEVDHLKKELEKICKEKDGLEDSYKRKVAEFDNYRKRMLKQMEDSAADGTKKIVAGILPIMDNFDRALKHSEQNKDYDALFGGLKITSDQIGSFFKHLGVEPIESLGKEFDPNLHEAVMMEERGDVEFPNTVVDELEKGYRLGDFIIRHSKVKVAKKKNSEEK